MGDEVPHSAAPIPEFATGQLGLILAQPTLQGRSKGHLPRPEKLQSGESGLPPSATPQAMGNGKRIPLPAAPGGSSKRCEEGMTRCGESLSVQQSHIRIGEEKRSHPGFQATGRFGRWARAAPSISLSPARGSGRSYGALGYEHHHRYWVRNGTTHGGIVPLILNWTS